MYAGQSSAQPVLQDSGTAAGGAAGVNPKELGVTVRGTGTAPYANAGSGPLGTNLCDYDGPITAAAGYHFLCLSPNAQGGGLLAYGAAGGASALPFNFSLNGSTYEFPVAVGGITGPVSSTVGNLAIFNNTSGNLLADSGNALTKPGPTWASPGTTIYDALRMSVNNFPVGAQFGNNAAPLVEGIVGAIEVPSSATGGNATFGIAGYGRTASTTTGAVGVFGGGSANADGVSSWGGNFLVTNMPLLQGSADTGHTDTVGYGIEIDVNLQTAQGAAAPNSAMRGLYLIGDSTTAPSGGLAATFEAIGIDSPGVHQSPHVKWNNAIYTYDGATTQALNIGTTGTGNNVGSQSIILRARDSGATAHSASVEASPSGDLTITPESNAAVFLAGALNAINTANAANKIAIVGALTSGAPEILSQGTDTNIGLVFGTKGTGSFAFNVGNTGVLSLGIGGTGANALSFQTASSGAPALLGTTSGPLGLTSSTGLVQFVANGSWADNGSVAATFTANSAPTGAHTTIQHWLKLVDDGGTTVYIPTF